MKTKIICINLEKDVERREFIKSQLGDQVEFFPAIDASCLEIDGDKLYYRGKLLSGIRYDEKMYLYKTALGFGRRHYRRMGIPYANVNASINGNIVSIIHEGYPTFYTDITPYKKNLSKTELACALSHYFVQKQLTLDSSCDAYIILEDDVIVDNLNKILKHLELYFPLVDVLFLNHAQFTTPDSLIDYTSMMNLGVFSGYSGAYSYILTKHGARKLMDAYNGVIGMTADDFISNQIQLLQLRVKEPLCRVKPDFESTIKTSLEI